MSETEQAPVRIAILGGGPSGLFMYKRLVETGRRDFAITIFEATGRLGEGFPYSTEGANHEHITNVSSNEIPDIVLPIGEWIKTVPAQRLQPFGIDEDNFNDYKVLPRLLFGKYLAAQFDLLHARARQAGMVTTIRYNSMVTDIRDDTDKGFVTVEINGGDMYVFDRVIICTGHHWPVSQEGSVPGYFDSPYPPKKLLQPFNHPVAIRGASLTAIDAIRTLARQHGKFIQKESPSKKIVYALNEDAANFKIVMHSRSGMLPAVRFHLEDPHLSKDKLLTKADIEAHMKGNEGFVALDFIFEKDFKEPLRRKDPILYEQIKDMQMEDFVAAMLGLRERIDAFDLFKSEYAQAAGSIRRKESVHWKEALAILSFAMNYPAKHLSAEDMLRLQQSLMPLISIVIAFVPQSSVEELIALHVAGLLFLVDVGPESKVVANTQGGIVYHHTDGNGKQIATPYDTYIDCVGQPHLSLQAFPFKSLIKSGTVSAARLKFRSPEHARVLLAAGRAGISTYNETDYYLQVPGLAINDNFQGIDNYGAYSERLYIMAVPYIGGFNPDYSGLDFCEAASKIIAESILLSYS
jgi:FAD-NAD(P)-binding